MAVDASESGATDAAGGLFARAEAEVNNVREMGGEIEHIVHRDGGDNSDSGTDGSFLMVTSSGDSDGRSDSKEKEISLAVGDGVARDPLVDNSGSFAFVDDVRIEEATCSVVREGNGEEKRKREDFFLNGWNGVGGCGRSGELQAANSGSSGCADDVRVEEPKGDRDMVREGNGRELVGEEERNRKYSCSMVNGWKGGKVYGGEDTANDGEGAEKIWAEEKEGETVALEDSNSEEQEEEVVAVNQNHVEEGVLIIEDCKVEKDEVIKDFNNEEDEMNVAIGDVNTEQDAVVSLDEGTSVGTETPDVQNEAGNVSERQSIGDASGQIFSLDPTIVRKLHLESSLKESEVSEFSITQPVTKDVKFISEVEETKKGNDERSVDVESSVNGKEEVDPASETEERRNSNVAVEDVDSSESAKEEISSIYELEDRRDANNEGCEDAESSINEPTKKGLFSDLEIEGRNNNEGCGDVKSADNDHSKKEVDSAFDVGEKQIANNDLSIFSNTMNETKSAIQVGDNIQNIATTTLFDGENGELNSYVEHEQQHQFSASLPKSGSESSIKLIAEPVEENIGLDSSVGQSIWSASGKAFSSDPCINEKNKLVSLIHENEVFVSSVTQPMNKDVELDSVIEERKASHDERSGVVESSVNEKKEVDSASEIEERRGLNDKEVEGVDSSEPAKEAIASIYVLKDRRDVNNEGCEDVESSVNEPNKKVLLSDSEIEESYNDEGHKDFESAVNGHAEKEVDSAIDVGERKIASNHLSIFSNSENETNLAIQVDESLQNITTTTVCDSENGELNSSAEQVQQHELSTSLPDSEEKEHKSSFKLTAEPVKEKIGSASMGQEYQVAEGLSTDKSTELVDECILATRGENKYGETWSTGSKPEHSKEELGSDLDIEGIRNAELSVIDSYPEPVKQHLTSTSKVEEDKDADASSIYSNPVPVIEDIDSASKPKQDVVAVVTETDCEKMDLQLSTELADVVIQLVKDQVGTENLQTDSESDKALMKQTINESRELKLASKFTKLEVIHLDKDMLEIEGQPKAIKLEENQADVHIRTQQENVASSASASDGENSEKHVKRYYIVKIHRFNPRVIDDERQAKMQIDEKTRRRDSIMAELRDMRKVLSDFCDIRDSAIKDEKRVKSLLNAKRQEIDSTQALIIKGKNVASFLDISAQIHTLEHTMQHETISLKDEKNCLHELKQLKHERENHPVKNYSQSEFDEALGQKKTAESSLRALKKEFDILRSEHLKADEYLKAASKSYFDQFHKIKEHEKKWKAANNQRQNAFQTFHNLKSHKLYRMYLNDKQTAMKYASSGDTKALERFCTEQIERVMQLWNEDEDFRRQYIESSGYSRTRGRNEELVVPPSNIPPASTIRSSAAPVISCKEQTHLAQEVTIPVLQTKQMVRPKPSPKSTLTEVAPVIGASKEELVEVAVKEKLKKEEVEQARLADEQAREQEELRKGREAAELKEKIRMEQKAKAKEAEERKRRRNEKAQARAEYRAQKEAELREQKRANKQKKKEATSETSGSAEGNPASVTETCVLETVVEPENNHRRRTCRKSAALNKYSNDRVQPVPLPLRNKGKRKMPMWKWIVLAVAVFLLFIVLLHFSDLAF